MISIVCRGGIEGQNEAKKQEEEEKAEKQKEKKGGKNRAKSPLQPPKPVKMVKTDISPVKTDIPSPSLSGRPVNSQRLRTYLEGKAKKKKRQQKRGKAENRRTEKKKGKVGPNGRRN